MASPISEIANREKKVPAEWITAEGNNVTEAMREYLRPLVQGEEHCRFVNGVPHYVVLL
jgi:6-phosphofructokinase 1